MGDRAESLEALGQALRLLAQRLEDALPRALGAGGLLVVGWGLARLLRALVVRLLVRLGRLLGERRLESGLRRVGIERSPAEIVGAVVFWGVLLVFITAAADVLGLPLLATWLGALSTYLPRLLLAVLIVLAGILLANLARDAVRAAAAAAGVAYEDLISRLVQGGVFTLAVVTAVDQLGVDIAFLTAALLIALGTLAASVALAFALGARTAVSNIIACHYVQQTHRVGHVVRIGAVEGRIVEFTTGAVILEGPEGRVLVPAKAFSEGVSFFGAGAP